MCLIIFVFVKSKSEIKLLKILESLRMKDFLFLFLISLIGDEKLKDRIFIKFSGFVKRFNSILYIYLKMEVG